MSRSSMFTRVALALALLFVSASLVDAQDQDQDRGDRRQRRGGNFGRGGFGRGGFGGTNKLTLVRYEQVQKEIKVTEEQEPKIEELLAAYREESRGGRGRGRDGGGRGDRSEEARAEREKQRQAVVATFEKKLDGLLEKPQLTRLNQIALQQQGARGLTEGPVAASLKLDEKQVGQLKAIFKTQDDDRQKLFESVRGGGGGREGFAEMREKLEKMQKDADTKALAVLSDEQKKEYAALKGKEFTLERQAGFGRGRGGEGGRGGRDGEGRGGQRRRPPVDDA